MGIQQAMLARSGGASGGIVSPLAGGGGTSGGSATLSVDSNGKISFNGTLINNWYSPTTVGIGSSYWARITKSSGDAPDTNGASTWTQISLSLSVNYGSAPKSGDFLIEISSDSGGSTVVTSGTYTMAAS